MAFLSGLLGSLGGPGNIIKSVGEFVSDSLSNLSKGEGWSGIAKAGSKAVKTLAGLPSEEQIPERQISNMRPIMVTNDQIPNNTYPGRSLADMRPIISTSGDQPTSQVPIRVRPKNQQYMEYRKTSGGFPDKTMINVTNLSKGQKKKLKQKEKRYKNYMNK